jgi:hypothetical protein
VKESGVSFWGLLAWLLKSICHGARSVDLPNWGGGHIGQSNRQLSRSNRTTIRTMAEMRDRAACALTGTPVDQKKNSEEISTRIEAGPPSLGASLQACVDGFDRTQPP